MTYIAKFFEFFCIAALSAACVATPFDEFERQFGSTDIQNEENSGSNEASLNTAEPKNATYSSAANTGASAGIFGVTVGGSVQDLVTALKSRYSRLATNDQARSMSPLNEYYDDVPLIAVKSYAEYDLLKIRVMNLESCRERELFLEGKPDQCIEVLLYGSNHTSNLRLLERTKLEAVFVNNQLLDFRFTHNWAEGIVLQFDPDAFLNATYGPWDMSNGPVVTTTALGRAKLSFGHSPEDRYYNVQVSHEQIVLRENTGSEKAVRSSDNSF